MFNRYEKNTKMKIRSAMKAYVRWMTCRNYQVEYGLIPADRKVPNPDELIFMEKSDVIKVLCMFILEVKNAAGDDYTRDTLYDLIVMVQAFFKQNRRPFKFFEDDEFFYLKNTLDNRMRALSKMGKVAPHEKAVPISFAEDEKLWGDGVLGDKTPVQLVDTLLYLLGVHFALRAAEEHKSLRVDCQLSVHYDDSVGMKYIYYQEMSSKCNQGGISDRGNPLKTGRAYENVVNSDRCVVRLYEKYMSHRPSHLPKCSKDFYLRPLGVPNGDIWYSCQARGRHTLEKVIKKLCQKAGFSGKRTNHSCRASSATRMYELGADEQLICEKTGHRSVAVRSYKRTSNQQLKSVSDMLYGNVDKVEGNTCSNKKLKVEPTSTVSKCPDNEDKASDGGGQGKATNSTHSVELPKGVVVNINLNVK